MTIAHLFNLFIVGGFAGWVYECIYCTVKTTRWQNRGFLFGPVCPIYGLGFVGGYLLLETGILDQICEYASGINGGKLTGKDVSWIMIFIICALGSAILEYSTSFVLEKLFHARWWDYSHVPINLNGRICLPATLGFATAGVLIIRYVIPYLSRHIYTLQHGFSQPTEEILSLGLMCVLGADLGLSISSVSSLMDTLEKIEAEFNVSMETRYEPIGKTQRTLARRIAGAGTAVVEKLGSARDSADEYKDALVSRARNLPRHQVNVLMNIEVFSSIRHTGVARKLKEIIWRLYS